MNSSQDDKTRLEELLIRWEDDELGPEETEELIRTLQEDKSARDALTTHFMMDVGITRGVKEAPTGNTVPFSVRVRESSVLWKRWLIPLAAAASVMIAVGVWWLKPAAGLGLRVAEVSGECSVFSVQYSEGKGAASGVTESPGHQVAKSGDGGKLETRNSKLETAGAPLKVGDVLRPGDGVEVGADGYVKLAYPDTTQVELQHDTRMRVTRGAGSEKTAKRLALDGGTLVCSAAPQRKPFEITTPHAVARVVGTRFNLGVTKAASTLAVQEGKVALCQGDKTLLVSAGQTAVADASGMNLTSPGAAYQMRIDLSGYKKAAVLTNFPVLVVLGANRAGFAYSQFVSTNGWDLRFTGSDGVTELPYEIEKWDVSGLSYVWVRVPQLNSGAWIMASWGQAANAAQQAYTTNGAVWANGYAAVWHLGNGATLSGVDSIANGNNGTVYGATAAAGCVDGGGNFVKTGSQRVTAPYSASLAITNNLTLEAWINAASFSALGPNDNSIIGCVYTLKEGYGLRCGQQNGIGTLVFVFRDGAAGNRLTVVDSAGNMSVGQWYHVVGTYDKQNPKIYVNGQFRNSAGSTASLSVAAIDGVSIGAGYSANSWGRFFDGRIDEARISSVARSGDWVWAAYMNVASNDTFCAYGAVQAPLWNVTMAIGEK